MTATHTLLSRLNFSSATAADYFLRIVIMAIATRLRYFIAAVVQADSVTADDQNITLKHRRCGYATTCAPFGVMLF